MRTFAGGRARDTPLLLSHLVPQAAARIGDRPAVRCLADELTYNELDQRVATLAGALVEAGVQSGDRVGIHVHKSLETMVGVHGILRAGAAYVPLDALAPIEMLDHITVDCGIEVVVTHDARRMSIIELCETSDVVRHIVGLSEAVPGTATTSWDQVSKSNPIAPVEVLSDDLAYVMYTSGSTGVPKGIMHTHRSGLRYALQSAAIYGLNSDDKLANFSPLHFDMSTFEMFAGPSAGACSVILTEPYLMMPASCAELLSRERCTVTYTVPSVYLQLLYRGGLDQYDLSSVRWLNFGGEVFPPAALADLMSHFPAATVSNVYGPAEVNQVTFHHITEPPAGEHQVPIGRACPDVDLSIVGPDGRRVAHGEAGELMVRSSTMMQGYWNRPDLDAAAFDRVIAPGGRVETWFRTGDIVSADESGVLTFVGRRDHQVKVRGHRVELEWIESALGDVPKVEHAVVGVRRGEAGSDELIAAVVLAPGADFDVADIRRQLADRLPAYAVPSQLSLAEDFPRTASGKVDRRAARTELTGRCR
ncbi:MAG: amino acid adenylation domain-containing protein [Acidimicrobiales bacterium]